MMPDYGDLDLVIGGLVVLVVVLLTALVCAWCGAGLVAQGAAAVLAGVFAALWCRRLVG
jgi:hypothetical protein